MFGPQWNEAADLVPIFCLAGAFAATWSLLLNALMAVGRIDLVTRTELTIQPLRALLIVSAALVFESLLACAIAFLITFALITPLLYRVKDKCIPTDYPALWRGLIASVQVSVLALALPALLLTLVPSQNQLAGMAMLLTGAGMLAVLSWTVALAVLNHPLKADPIMQRLFSRLPLLH
jgi:O-antigen/teichoic acid export membrane protein